MVYDILPDGKNVPHYLHQTVSQTTVGVLGSIFSANLNRRQCLLPSEIQHQHTCSGA